MSETIDLTRGSGGDDDDPGRRSEQTPQQEGRRQRRRRRTTSTRPSSRPSSVYVVIHDKEPQDSGSDYNYSASLPSRQDTKIVGIFYEYNSAAQAAEEYVVDEFFLDDCDEEDDSDNDEPLGYIDWRREGWLREEDCDANECDDRVHIEVHQVK